MGHHLETSMRKKALIPLSFQLRLQCLQEQLLSWLEKPGRSLGKVTQRLFIDLKKKNSLFKWTLRRTGSQWREVRIGVMCSLSRVLVKRSASSVLNQLGRDDGGLADSKVQSTAKEIKWNVMKAEILLLQSCCITSCQKKINNYRTNKFVRAPSNVEPKFGDCWHKVWVSFCFF